MQIILCGNRWKENKVIVFGCGGHARSIVNVLMENSKDIEILMVDRNAQSNEFIMGYKAVREYEMKENDGYIVAFGDNAKRKKKYQNLLDIHAGQCISVISGHSYIGTEVQIGQGSFVAANTYLGPLAKIGNNTIINTGSIVEHESMVGNNTHIAPNATVCGRVRIGNNVLCGAGSTIIDHISICDNAVIGAGAVVKENIVEQGTYVGVPAKKIS